MNTLVVVLCLLVMVCHGRLVPFTPCGKLFNYFESETKEIFGAMTFKNDLSGKYHLKVTMSIPTKTDKVIKGVRQNALKMMMVVGCRILQ